MVIYRPLRGHHCQQLRRWVTRYEDPYPVERGLADRYVRHGLGEILEEDAHTPEEPGSVVRDGADVEREAIRPTVTRKALEERTVSELRENAETLGIDHGGMRKVHLVDAVHAAINGPGEVTES